MLGQSRHVASVVAMNHCNSMWSMLNRPATTMFFSGCIFCVSCTEPLPLLLRGGVVNQRYAYLFFNTVKISQVRELPHSPRTHALVATV